MLQADLEAAQRKVNEKMASVERIRVKIDQVDNDMRNFKGTHRTLTEKKQNIGEQLHNLARLREPKVILLILQ